MNINILRISDRMDKNGQINSDDHYIYYCGQESLSRHGVALTVNERVQNAVHGWQSQKRKTLVHFQSKPFNITVMQVYAPKTNAKELELHGYTKTYKTF